MRMHEAPRHSSTPLVAAILILGSACVQRPELGDPIADDTVANKDDLALEVERTLHARTVLVNDGETALVWSSHVDTSAELVAVEPLRGEGAPIAGTTVPGVDGDDRSGFELEFFDADLRRALRGAPVSVRLTLEGGAEIDVAFEIGIEIVDRVPAFPFLLPSRLHARGGDALVFEGSLGGPALDAVDVTAAAAPEVTRDGAKWLLRWGLDDVLTSAMWRNGSVEVHALRKDGSPVETRGHVAPAVLSARTSVASTFARR